MRRHKRLEKAITLFCVFLITACGVNPNSVDPSHGGSSSSTPHRETVPIYQGMSISKLANWTNNIKKKNNGDLDSEDESEYGNEDPDDDITSENINDDDPSSENDNNYGHEEHDNDIETEIGDIVTIDVETDDEIKYFVKPNETFIVEVHISNPDQFEIQSFTLNGEKYANYMFRVGSTMELLLLEVNAPTTPGYFDYSIDAIKYIDGTEIKDVDMSKGNKRIRTGILYDIPPKATIINQNISTTYAELTIEYEDFYQLTNDEDVEALLAILLMINYSLFMASELLLILLVLKNLQCALI